jgi:hypothetical protein
MNSKRADWSQVFTAEEELAVIELLDPDDGRAFAMMLARSE